ncbi:Sperm acrosomal protein FSA-ACR.1 [Pteropus alecto]|uniref:Sperm acrosomal protein FSA-ACR.1 n=1 Tax=Pteropus alecto TaxID=9402 RepID=L5KEM0_PTEAL|nr:Sperm acrosomal protein FSA-ACR.1 [Pteropus alecto]
MHSTPTCCFGFLELAKLRNIGLVKGKTIQVKSLFCSFSITGASGQPDESPGIIDDQASVQQFSGEHLSLANPSDSEALYETSSGKNILSAHASAGRAPGEHASGDQGSDEHTAASEHAAGEHTAGEHDASEHTSGESSGEQSSSEKPSSEQPSAEQPSEQPSAEQPSEQPAGEQPSSEKALNEQPSGEQPSGEKASSEQTLNEQAAGEQATDEQASVEKPAGEQPSGSPAASTFSGPALNCHVCSYMNDKGKCLRGESVCSTQNTQQCMLKKIFEGGKLQFMVQGCENMCPSMNLFSHGTRMQIICCRNQSFCNKI